MKIFGQFAHMDCRGYGNICKLGFQAEFETINNPDNEIILIVSDIDSLGQDLEYPFPNRTLFITNPQNNTDLWLNIPEQILTREDLEQNFIIYDAWFSEEPELEND